jgi:hypothetical protein
MNIAQKIILMPPTLRSIGRVYPPALSGGQLSKPCTSFGGNQAMQWNPFSYLFGKIHQAFTIFSQTRVGQWVGTWLKKINNFLQAPKKEPPKAASPVPSPATASPINAQSTSEIASKPSGEPASSQPPVETSHQPPPQQAKPKAAPKATTPHEQLMDKSRKLLADQKGIQYSTLSIGELSKKLSAFKQASDHCQSQQNRLSNELKILQSLKGNQIQLLRPASSNYKKLKDELVSASQGGNGNTLSPKAEKKLKFKLKAQKKAQKGFILELKAGLRLLETKIEAHSTAFKETSRQLDKTAVEVEKLKSWVNIQTELGKIQPLPDKPG